MKQKIEEIKALQEQQIKECKDIIAASQKRISEFESKNKALQRASTFFTPTEFYTNCNEIIALRALESQKSTHLINLLEIQNQTLTALLEQANYESSINNAL